MAGMFSQAGSVGSNIADYTSLPFAPGMEGMGPIASGQQYGQFLQSQQPSFLSQFGSGLSSAGQQFNALNELMGPTQPMQFNQFTPMRQPTQLQQTNLMDFLSMLGGR